MDHFITGEGVSCSQDPLSQIVPQTTQQEQQIQVEQQTTQQELLPEINSQGQMVFDSDTIIRQLNEQTQCINQIMEYLSTMTDNSNWLYNNQQRMEQRIEKMETPVHIEEIHFVPKQDTVNVSSPEVEILEVKKPKKLKTPITIPKKKIISSRQPTLDWFSPQTMTFGKQVREFLGRIKSPNYSRVREKDAMQEMENTLQSMVKYWGIDEIVFDIFKKDDIKKLITMVHYQYSKDDMNTHLNKKMLLLCCWIISRSGFGNDIVKEVVNNFLDILIRKIEENSSTKLENKPEEKREILRSNLISCPCKVVSLIRCYGGTVDVPIDKPIQIIVDDDAISISD